MIQVEIPDLHPMSAPEFPSDPSEQAQIRVILPPTVKTGDWCLFIERSRHGRDLPHFFGLEWVVLIVRSTEDAEINKSSAHFTIFGKGYAFQMSVFGPGALTSDGLLEGQDAFQVYCTVEDALVLATSFIDGIPIAMHARHLEIQLSMLVCGWPGSAFAVRSDDGQSDWGGEGESEMISWITR